MDIRGKRVLVTGSDGFIGSHLAEALVHEGANVRSLVLYNSFNSWGWLDESPLNRDMEIVLGDVRDANLCHQITKDIDIVFNLAALIAIPYSYIAPESYVDTNIKGALNICQSSLNNRVERVVQVSTSEVYGSAQYIPIDEKHPLQPQSPYSASKIGADAIAMSFYYTFGLPVIIARPFNTYGPRQSARAVIPTIITQIAQGKHELKIGDTSPTRDFNYVTDTCMGLIMLAKCEAAIGETVNIGSNYEVSISDIIDRVKSIMRSDIKVKVDVQRIRPEKSEVNRLWCDNSYIKTLTGFTPHINIEDGLKETINWITKPDNLKKYKEGLYVV